MKATRREWLGLAVLALPALLLSLDVSVLYLALPQLSGDLRADGTQQLWIMDVYSFMLAGFLVTMGTLGDRIGRRRLLLVGAAAFGIVSVAAAYADSAESLIVCRALLGIAGATLMPSSMALIKNMFHDPAQLGAAIGIWFSCFMGGMTLGPLVGGLLLEHFWWGSAFLLGVPVMVLVLVVAPILLPEYRDENAGRLDPMSVALSLTAILPLIYGLKETARNGVDGIAMASLAVGVTAGAVFVRRQRRLADPLLDLRLFADRIFSTSLGMMLIGGVVMAGTSLVSTLYLQMVAGLSPLHAGLWLIPQNLVMVACLMTAPALAQKIHPARLIFFGLAVGSVGFLIHTRVGAEDGLPLVVLGLVLASGGIAVPMALGTGMIMTGVPAEKAGAAAAINETGGEFGVALGVATLGTLATAVYRSDLSAVTTADDPARDGLAAALNRPELLDAARAAFTHGLNAVAWVSAAAFLLLGTAAYLTFRHLPAPATAPEALEATPEPIPEPIPA